MQNLMPPIGTPDNLFHDGNPLTGEQGTIVTAAHLNNVQGATRDLQTELLAVLADAKIEVNPEDHAQLLKALKAVIGTFGATKFLSTSKNLKEIADAGPEAIAAALQNLQIGSAGKRNVGTGAGQIPDSSAFSSLLNSGAGWKKIPDAASPTGFFILQWGKFSGNGTIRVNGNFPIAFPNTVLISFGFMSDSAQFGSPSSARIVNLEATSQSTWGMGASAETSAFRFGFITLGF